MAPATELGTVARLESQPCVLCNVSFASNARADFTATSGRWSFTLR